MKTRISGSRLFAGALCICAAGQAMANTAVLNPGTINGLVNLSGETVNSGYVQSYSSDGFSSSSGFSGNTFSLTVEGNHSYNLYVDNYIADTDAWKYVRIYRYNDYLYVPAGGTVNAPLQYSTADITGSISVIGGTLNSYYVQSYAYATVGSVNEEYLSRYSGTGAISLPQILDDDVQISGYANCTTVYGNTVQVNLSAQNMAVGASGATVTWTLDLTSLQPGEVTGDFSLDASPLADIVSSHTAVAYNGDLGWPGNYYYASRAENGPYTVPNLYAADWYMYGYSYFDGLYGQFYWPGTWKTVPAGGSVTHNFSDQLAFIRGKLSVNGFFTNATISWAQVRATGPAGTAYDSIQPSIDPLGGFNLAVRPGDYSTDFYNLSIYDYNNVLSPLNVYQYVQYYPVAAPSVTLVDSDEHAHNGFISQQVETIVILDVVETQVGQQAPPQILITQPHIYATEFKTDSSGNALSYKYFQAWGTSTAQAKPALRIAAEPGNYSAQVYGYVNGSRALFANFNLFIPVPTVTPVGTGTIQPSPSVGITGTATATGVTSVVETPFGPSAPSGFRVNSPNGSTVYYDINSTATYTFPVKVCMNYDDTGLTVLQENQIRLYHYEGGIWKNITTTRNISTDIVCGNTNSFSPFAVMELNDGEGDGDGDGIATLDSFGVELDNCPDISNVNQADSDNDDIGDACDADNDNDGVEDANDNCPIDANADQQDSDGDGTGDACDTSGDTDEDGVADEDDACPNTEGDAATDSVGCSSKQLLEVACPQSKAWKNHGQYVSCVTKEAKRQADSGLITNTQKGAIVSEAANSSVGQ